jgi:hypothetical protein
VLANLLVRLGVLRRSFEDYAEWERTALAEHEAGRVEAQAAEVNAEVNAAVAGGVPANSSEAVDVAVDGADESASVTSSAPSEQEMWVRYPYARREMARELLFVGVIAACAVLAGYVAMQLAGPWSFNPNTLRLEPVSDVAVPLWAMVTSGTILGYLIGGGVVWAIRILGTLAFGKEALGLGDVHMMAAVGACLGWIDPTLAFFGAAFLGMAGWAIQLFASGENKRMLPYGPFLAMATILVWFCKPLIERLAGRMMETTINWP